MSAPNFQSFMLPMLKRCAADSKTAPNGRINKNGLHGIKKVLAGVTQPRGSPNGNLGWDRIARTKEA